MILLGVAWILAYALVLAWNAGWIIPHPREPDRLPPPSPEFFRRQFQRLTA